MAIGGASAGAHLSLCAALTPDVPAVAALVLVYPVVDPVGGPYDQRPDEVPAEVWLGRDETVALFTPYVGGVDLTACPVPALPLQEDLGTLPPTLVTTAGRDGLHRQGEALVRRLREVGGAVEHHHEARKFHGYANHVSASCDDAVTRHATWLRDALDGVSAARPTPLPPGAA